MNGRIPKPPLLRRLRAAEVSILVDMDAEWDALYAATGRESIPPERLLRASPI